MCVGLENHIHALSFGCQTALIGGNDVARTLLFQDFRVFLLIMIASWFFTWRGGVAMVWPFYFLRYVMLLRVELLCYFHNCNCLLGFLLMEREPIFSNNAMVPSMEMSYKLPTWSLLPCRFSVSNRKSRGNSERESGVSKTVPGAKRNGFLQAGGVRKNAN